MADLGRFQERPRSQRTGVLILLGCMLVVIAIPLTLARVFPTLGADAVLAPKPTLNSSQLRALTGDTVLISTQDGIYALRASDGTLRWRYPAQSGQGTLAYPSGALAVAGNVAYAVSSVPNSSHANQPVTALVALRVSDGHLLWSRPLTLSDFGEALTLSNGTLYLSPATTHVGNGYTDITNFLASTQPGDHTAYAIRASDGTFLWQVTTPQVLNGIPYAANGLVYLATAGTVEAVRASGGSQVWSTPMGPGSAHPEGQTQAYINGVSFSLQGRLLVTLLEAVRVVSTSGQQRQQTTTSQLVAYDAQTGAYGGFRCSSVTDQAPPIAYPVVTSGATVYQEGAGLWAISLAGGKLGPCSNAWPFWASLGAPQVGLTYVNGMVYSTDYGVQPLGDWRGTSGSYTHAVRASDGKEVWRAETNGGLMAQIPTAGGGLVYAGAGNRVQALDTSNGAHLWQYSVPTGSLITVPPAFARGQ